MNNLMAGMLLLILGIEITIIIISVMLVKQNFGLYNAILDFFRKFLFCNFVLVITIIILMIIMLGFNLIYMFIFYRT